MPNPYFRFKQFTVWHDKCAMRVNTDGVLLGAWTTINQPELILDVGTGTGLLALMMAQRSKASVHAVEIEESAFNQANFNVANSPWADRICVIHDDFCKYYRNCEHGYDLIISNPPYFSNSLKNPDPRKQLARHSDSLPFSGFLCGVSKLLSANGVFSVILPADTAEFEDEALLHGLRCIRRTLVRSYPQGKVLRQMLEFKKLSNFQSYSTDEINIYREPQNYSYIYIELTKDFYLNF